MVHQFGNDPGITTHYTDPSIDEPDGITAGPDGALWFTNSGNDSIGRITTGGTVTNYTDPSIDEPDGITAGPDGALWFTNSGNDSIGRITTSGVISKYTGIGIKRPTGISAGPDGALWFTNSRHQSIGRISTPPSITDSPSSGGPGTSVSISGQGFTSGEKVNVTYETGLASPSSVSICKTTANPDGTFSCSGNIRRSTAGANGSHKMKAKGMTSHAIATTTFTLT